MDIKVDAIRIATDIPACVSISQIQQASVQDDHLQYLKSFIITGWTSTKDKLHADLKPCWSYRNELAIIDRVMLKGRHIVMPTTLKQQVLDQLHRNHIGIGKTKLLACESVYWPSINADIEKYIKSCATCLGFQQTQPKRKMIYHDKSLRPWEVPGADIFHFNNKNYLCIVDYNSKFPMVKRIEGLSAESLITTIKVIFAECGIPPKLMSDAGTNFVSEEFQRFCNSINVEQAVSLAYHHQSNRQIEVCIKFVKHTLKNVPNLVGTSTWPYCKFVPLH